MSGNDNMGAVLGRVWPQKSAEFIGDASLDEVDPKLGLTVRQKRVIEENWRLVQQNITQNGVDFFLGLFKAYPAFQKEFKSFADVSMEDLPSNKKFHAHANNVMYALSSFVDNLDDADCLKELLISTGKRHGARKNTVDQFEGVAVVFVNFLDTKLGSSLTPFARKAWEELWKVMVTYINEGLELGRKK